MANPFSNAHKAVETYSFNKTNTRTIDNMSETAAANSALRKIKAQEQDSLYESQLMQDELHSYYNKLNEGVVNRYVRESQIPNNINRINQVAKEAILKDILFEVFYNSLLMDEYFLKENFYNIKHLTDKYVDDNGGFKVLDNAIKDSIDSTLLKKIKSVCESLALEVCNRKLSDSKESSEVDLIDFDMNEDEKNKLDCAKKDDLNIEKISELVKSKVLTVVKDEKERQELNSELIEKIEEDLKEDENVVDEKSLKEAMNNIVLSKSVVESSTLFDSLFRDSYQEYLQENVAITSTDKANTDDAKEMSKEYDTEMDIDDALGLNDDDDESVENSELNMDLILTEAITKYTLMETLYTLGLENYSYDNIRKLTERMLNPVSEAASNDKSDNGNEYIKERSEFFKLFNKLKDNPTDEGTREKLSAHINSLCENPDSKEHCKSFIKICKKEIDTIIEKNPKMKDKYTDLAEYIEGCTSSKE